MKIIRYLLLLFFIKMTCLVAVQAQQGQGRINVSAAKFRKCADLKCAIISQLNKGEVVPIIGQGKYAKIEGYGKYAWLKVKIRQQEGYVFGAVLDVLDKPSEEIPFLQTGYIREDNVNVRTCADLKNCAVIGELSKGTYCKILSKTKQTTTIQSMGTHPWYFVQVGKRQGYVFGGLLTLESDELIITAAKVKVYKQADTLQSLFKQYVPKGEKYTIKAQSPKSQLIRPYGRYYWYELTGNGTSIGWVFGAFTSKATDAAVNCQCVDYVKKVLSITGPTKNALDWDEVLQGGIPVKVNGKKTFLDYEEVLQVAAVQKGDIVIFDKLHPDADNTYGHIGIVVEVNKIEPATYWVRTEGANHKVPLRAYFEKNTCNNVNVKNYLVNEHTLFFRPRGYSE